MPVLAQVGDDWHQADAHRARAPDVFHDAEILGAFLRLYARREASARLLLATPSGERHEIGTLGAAMLAASSGLGVPISAPICRRANRRQREPAAPRCWCSA